MALVLQVGEDGNMPRPAAGFPKSGDFVSPLYGHVERSFPSYNISTVVRMVQDVGLIVVLDVVMFGSGYGYWLLGCPAV